MRVPCVNQQENLRMLSRSVSVSISGGPRPALHPYHTGPGGVCQTLGDFFAIPLDIIPPGGIYCYQSKNTPRGDKTKHKLLQEDLNMSDCKHSADVTRRLARISGQVNGIREMVQSGRP